MSFSTQLLLPNISLLQRIPKTTAMKTRLMLFAGIILLISCSKNEVPVNENLIVERNISTEKFQLMEIDNGDTLKANLGYFGDEEGAWIFEDPIHVKYDTIYRDLNSASIFYEYSPEENFSGRDTVGLILNRGSDGASPGINDSIRICIVIN